MKKVQVECKRFLGAGQGAEGVEKVLGEVLGAGQGAVVVVDAGVGAGCAWGRTRLWGELNKCLGSGGGAGGVEYVLFGGARCWRCGGSDKKCKRCLRQGKVDWRRCKGNGGGA